MFLSRANTALLLGAFLVTICLASVITKSSWYRPTVSKNTKVFLKEGYDFHAMRALNKAYSEPKIGTAIDLEKLETTRNKKPDLHQTQLLLLALIDPECSSCKASQDMMDHLRSRSTELGVSYLPIVLRSFPEHTNIQLYAEGMGFESCILWPTATALPEGMSSLGAPSHILLTNEGLILQVWQGTARDAATRMRMAEQISSDLFIVENVVRALQLRRPSSRTVGQSQN